VGFRCPSVTSDLSSKAIYAHFCIQVACLEEARKETGLIPTPMSAFLQKCILTSRSHGQRKAREALAREGKAGQLHQAERIFCVACPGALLKPAAAGASPQIAASSLRRPANVPLTSLTLDRASPP